MGISLRGVLKVARHLPKVISVGDDILDGVKRSNRTLRVVIHSDVRAEKCTVKFEGDGGILKSVTLPLASHWAVRDMVCEVCDRLGYDVKDVEKATNGLNTRIVLEVS